MITRISDMSKHRQVIFKKMFDAVGAPYDLILIDDWYCRYEWTEKQSDTFCTWFIDYLYKHREARKEICPTSNSKRDLRKVWCEFFLMWGWKYKE